MYKSRRRHTFSKQDDKKNTFSTSHVFLSVILCVLYFISRQFLLSLLAGADFVCNDRIYLFLVFKNKIRFTLILFFLADVDVIEKVSSSTNISNSFYTFTVTILVGARDLYTCIHYTYAVNLNIYILHVGCIRVVVVSVMLISS